MSVYEYTLEEIYNSDYMRKFRRKIALEEKRPECAVCFGQERQFGRSRRILNNGEWLPELGIDSTFLAEHGRSTDYAAYRPFNDLRLDMGDKCNLMCRMCNGNRNNRLNKIASMPTQIVSRHHQDVFLYETLFADPGLIRKIHFTGGEPLIIDGVQDALQFLVRQKAARHIHVTFSTNFTVLPDELAGLLADFRKATLFISIDGTEKVYEYIRYPARWQVIKDHIRKIGHHPHIKLSAAPLAQIYNLLNLTDLCRFLDDCGIEYEFNLIAWPMWLRVGLMPSAGRDLACDRLTQYAESLDSSREKSRREILSLVALIREETGDRDNKLMSRFMKRTDEFDCARSQNIRASLPELYRIFQSTALHWKAGEISRTPGQLSSNH